MNKFRMDWIKSLSVLVKTNRQIQQLTVVCIFFDGDQVHPLLDMNSFWMVFEMNEPVDVTFSGLDVKMTKGFDCSFLSVNTKSSVDNSSN